jgi:hypothetical protein
MQKGKMYSVRYRIRSSPSRGWMVARIGKQETWINTLNVDEGGQSHDYAFWYAWDDDPGAELQFHIGDSSARFYVTDVEFKELSLT